MKRFARLLVSSVLLMLAACAMAPSSMNPQDEALEQYGIAIRWSEFADAWALVDPELRQRQPLTDFDMERYKQIQVTGYDLKGRATMPDASVEQTVEIRLINRNTQVERTITDHQSWRWDPVAKRFWLTSGLPDFTAH
jgi:hypothetical protein